MNEYIVTAGVNDSLVVGYPTPDHTVTLTTGRYRDMIAFAAMLESALNSASFGTWSVTVNNTTGKVSLACNTNFAVTWTYTKLRDDLGYTGSETVS